MTTPIEEVSDRTLRAWADCRVISSARYVEEMERRAGSKFGTSSLLLDGSGDYNRIAASDTPPLDYALDDELAIPYLHHDSFVDPDAETVLAPPAVMWIIAIVAILFVTALWMVFR